MTPRQRWSFGLAHRLYVLVVLSVVFTAFVLALIGFLVFGSSESVEVDAEAQALRARLAPALLAPAAEMRGQPARLQQLADDTTRATHVSLAIYDDRGHRLAASGRSRLEPLSADELARLDAEGVLELVAPDRLAVRLPSPDGAQPAYGVVRFPPVRRQPPPHGGDGIPYLRRRFCGRSACSSPCSPWSLSCSCAIFRATDHACPGSRALSARATSRRGPVSIPLTTIVFPFSLTLSTVPVYFSILAGLVFPGVEEGTGAGAGVEATDSAGCDKAGFCCAAVTATKATHATAVAMRITIFILRLPPCKEVLQV